MYIYIYRCIIGIDVYLCVHVCNEFNQSVLQITGHRQRHPPVQNAQLPICSPQQIARVWVAVEHSRVEQHGHVGVDRHPAQPVKERGLGG